MLNSLLYETVFPHIVWPGELRVIVKKLEGATKIVKIVYDYRPNFQNVALIRATLTLLIAILKKRVTCTDLMVNTPGSSKNDETVWVEVPEILLRKRKCSALRSRRAPKCSNRII